MITLLLIEDDLLARQRSHRCMPAEGCAAVIRSFRLRGIQRMQKVSLQFRMSDFCVFASVDQDQSDSVMTPYLAIWLPRPGRSHKIA